MAETTELARITRSVLIELSRMAFAGTLDAEIENMLTTIVREDGPRHRCCVHKERAVLRQRINLALCQPMDNQLQDSALAAEQGEKKVMPAINVMPEACDQCPLDKFIVTDACRNCVAHYCIAACPKKAITVLYERAYIDKTKCVECGMCKKSCHYGAIIEVSRPCEHACALKAIKAGKDRRAKIDYDLCVQCGACKEACPFGAIGERSNMVYVIGELKKKRKVYALVAPAIIGQFGVKISLAQVRAALKSMGFYDMLEVSLGADIVALEETKEFMEKVPDERSWMTTSCCPAFVAMVEKHLPALKEYMSTTVSPMVALAKVVHRQEPEAAIVFIGPCTAKKVEAEGCDDIDYVLTFEELAAMMVGCGVNVESQDGDEKFVSAASADGTGFAKAGGVSKAVIDTAAALAPNIDVKAHQASGLENCKKDLIKLNGDKLEANFFEGMACEGGCINGPGTLADCRITGKFLEIFADTVIAKRPQDNEAAIKYRQQGIHYHRK